MTEVEQMLRRIEGNKSVRGTVVLDSLGRIVHSALRSGEKSQFDVYLPPLIERASSLIKDLDPTNELTFMRIHTDNVEILIGPGEDYTLIVIQDVVLIE